MGSYDDGDSDDERHAAHASRHRSKKRGDRSRPFAPHQYRDLDPWAFATIVTRAAARKQRAQQAIDAFAHRAVP